RLDLDDVGAEIGQHHGGGRCSDEGAHVEHAKIGERQRLAHWTAPILRSRAISSRDRPASARISSLCWPSAGAPLAICGSAKPSLIGLASVRGISAKAVSTTAPHATAC